MVAKDVQKIVVFVVVLQQMIEKWRVGERERVQVKTRQAFACRVKGADPGVQFSGRPVSRQNSAAASGTR